MNAEDYIICPHCGKENLIQATRCIFCKEDLDIIPKSATDLAANEEDLSQMLSAMAEENRELEVPTPQDNPGNLMPETYNSQLPNNEENDSDEIPTWLAHVRQRAQTEGDAQGLYNRKNESVSGQKLPSSESLGQPFNSWVGRIRESRTNDEASADDTVDAKVDEMPVWLKRVRDLQLQPDENAVQKLTGVEAWKQEWSEEDLERLKNGEFDEKLILQPSILDRTRAAEAGATIDKTENDPTQPDQASTKALSNSELAEKNSVEGEFSDSPTSDQSATFGISTEPKTADLQEAQTEILKEVLADESVPQYKKLAEPPKKSDIWRWIGILFLLAILAAFYFLFLNRPAPAPLGSAAGTAFWNRLDSLQPADKVLIILDYQPATAGEMHSNLQPIMARLKAQNAQVSLVALWPDGLWLGRELLEEAVFPITTELNFLPGGSLAMLASAAGLNPASPALETNTSLISNSLALKGKEFILYATDNPESAKIWIEQVGSFLQPEQSLMVSTQASQVMLQPYYDSSQIAGLSTSPYLADGQLGVPNPPAAASPAFEAGMGVMAGFLALSFIRKIMKTGKSTTNGDGQD